jgi:hypothetical protein
MQITIMLCLRANRYIIAKGRILNKQRNGRIELLLSSSPPSLCSYSPRTSCRTSVAQFSLSKKAPEPSVTTMGLFLG